MGIPSYFNSILNDFQYIYKNVKKHKINELFIDANSIIYDSLRELLDMCISQDEKSELLREIKHNPSILYDKTKTHIESIIDYIEPNFAFIAFDGIVPIAKMKQQRERRFKGVITKKLTDFIERKGNNIEHDCTLFNTVEITPGTDFMNGLDNYFTDIVLDLKKNIPIVFSLSNEPGEGEHKICSYIRNNINTDYISSFYGLDADLFILALNHLEYRKNIFLVREQPSYNTVLREIYDEDDFVCISINCLATEIINKVRSKSGQKHISTIEKQYIIKDYVFLSFFAGNDFLPHIFGLSLRRCGFDILLNTYNSVLNKMDKREKDRHFITSDCNISFKFLKMFFNELNNVEHKLVTDEYEWIKKTDNKIKYKWQTLTSIDKINNIPCINREKEDYIDVRHKNWENRYYDIVFENEHIPKGKHIDKYSNLIQKMCWNYIQGLDWVLKYYSGYDISNVNWYYKYDDAPLIQSIYNNIPTIDIELFSKNNHTYNFTKLNPYTQLIYVLPPYYHYLIPNQIIETIYEFIPQVKMINGFVSTFLKRYFWEGCVVTPNVEIITIDNLLSTLSI